MVLKGATLVEFEPASVEIADLRLVGDKIVERAASVQPQAGDEVIDLTGRVVMPGLVSAHHRVCAGLLRGARRAGVGFESEKALLNHLEASLTEDDIEPVVAAGAMEGLAAGTTTVFGVHSSPKAVSGSLSKVAHGLNGVGLRAVLAYEVTEGGGAVEREAALEECVDYLARARGRFRGALAVGQLGSLTDDALAGVREAHAKGKGLLLVNIAEDPREEARSQAAFGATPVERLSKLGLIGGRALMAQGVHLAWPELSALISQGTWLAHTPRSNMASQAGLATAAKFGVRACLGTEVMGLDVLAEAQVAALRASDSGQPIDLLRFLANGHRLASEAFGATVGPLREGALADLLVLDYAPPTPLEASTLAGHVLFGLSSRNIESVMVDGLWRLWKRKPLAVDAGELAKAAREVAGALWSRSESGGAAPS